MVTMRAKNRLFRFALTLSILVIVWPAVSPSQDTGSVATVVNPGLAGPSSQEPDRFKLSPRAFQVAQLIGIEGLIRRLSSLNAPNDHSASRGMSLGELSLRQQITEAVTVASLDVDDVLDRIDYEREQIVELKDILRSRRDRAVGTTNLATLALGTGLGAVSGILQFSETTKSVGDKIGVAAGGISTLLSFHSIRQQHSGQRPAWILPSMLAPLLGVSEEQHSDYPNDIWAYLNSASPEGASQMSRRERMLAGWREASRTGPLDSARAKTRIALLTDTDAAEKKLKLDVLSERGAMLADVRDEVSQMKRDLRDLLGAIRVSP